MRSRSLRPPDIVLPPPFPSASNQQPQTPLIAPPAPLKTPDLRPRYPRSISSNGASTVKRSRTTYGLPETPVRQQSISYFNFEQPLRTPSLVSSSNSLVEAARSDSISTDDDEGDNSSEPDTPNSSPSAPWTPQQDRILRRAIDFHLSDPCTAPFAGTTPPSTLIHRIAKTAMKLADGKAVDMSTQHSLADVRKRVSEITSSFEDTHAIASPVLRDAGHGGIQNLTEAAISNDLKVGSYFPLPLKSPFHEGARPVPLPSLSKRKLAEIETSGSVEES